MGASGGAGGDINISVGSGGGSSSCQPNEVLVNGQCVNACVAAKQNKNSVGCDYYAVALDGYYFSSGACFVSFVANTFPTNAHITAEYEGMPLDLSTYAKIPSGSGQSLKYDPYDPAVGLAPGQIAILFLSYDANGSPGKPVACPVPAAISKPVQVDGTGLLSAFHIQSDLPIVAYQMLPYGGGSAAVTGASLLLPTSAWNTNYLAVNAYDIAQPGRPTMAIAAMENNTAVTVLPKNAITGGAGVAAAAANTPVTYTLNAGQVLQITQDSPLTGSPIQSDKPIGFWAAHECAFVGNSACDHMESQIPPIGAIGNEYAGVSFRPRKAGSPENPPWKIIGVADGTQLSYEPAVGGPATINFGQQVQFNTSTPFRVKSQDSAHPFLLLHYMDNAQGANGYGDPELVRITPSAQYLNRYVFFTDPTYPDTNLVVVRKKGPNGFPDVSLDCAGKLSGWQAIGASAEYEYTRIDLVKDFVPQGACDNGHHEMKSDEPFGLWVWGFGGPNTTGGICPDMQSVMPPQVYTCYVSYGYPAGEGVTQINDIQVLPVPK